jgi:hypothetical protein
MGYFGNFVYSDGRWAAEPAADCYLATDVHDSDIATVDYHAEGAGGRFYLGFQPSDYFEDPGASEPIDVGQEASRFAAWAQDHLGATASAADLRPLLAEVGDEPEEDFVEETVARSSAFLGCRSRTASRRLPDT